MNFDTHLNLQGEYTVDVYNKDGGLTYSIGPHKNFITSTGLSYIHNFAIADCFRYLSIGKGNAQNTIKSTVNGGWGTVGLQTPQEGCLYSYIGGRTIQNDPGHLTSLWSTASFNERPSGISLTRGWRVPSGTALFEATDTIREIMLSPGRPIVTGLVQSPDVTEYFSPPDIKLNAVSITHTAGFNPAWTTNQWVNSHVRIYDSLSNFQERVITSNTSSTLNWNASLPVDTSDPYSYNIYRVYQLCTSQDTTYDIENNFREGLDYSSSAIFYAQENAINICQATGAFVRIVKDIPVTKDSFMIFNYTLYVDVETGRVDFSFDMQAGRNQRNNKNQNWWGHLESGCHNLIHHGLKVISPGTITTLSPGGGNLTQDGTFWNAEYDYGESAMTSWGAPLEPSCRYDRLSAYLTSDNLQFYANAKDGGESGINLPGFSGQSGLMLWRRSPYQEAISGGVFPSRLYNIRQANTFGETRAWPYPTLNSLPNGVGFEEETITPELDPPDGFNYTPQHYLSTFQTSVDHWTNTTNLPSSRTREVIRSFQFAGTSDTVGFTNEVPIRGMVLAYIDPNAKSYHLPYFDCLFTDSGAANAGRATLLPLVNKLVPKQYSTGHYNYWYTLEPDAKLTFSFRETWSSPCSPDVDGC